MTLKQNGQQVLNQENPTQHIETRHWSTWVNFLEPIQALHFQSSHTLEARRNGFATSTNEHAERNRHVQVNSKHIGLNSRAEASRHLQVGKPFKHSTTLFARWRSPNDHIDEPQYVSTGRELQSVTWAKGVHRWSLGCRTWLWLRRLGCRAWLWLRRLGWRTSSAGCGECGEEEEGED